MRRLHLSSKERKLLGVCGGIGETYDIDPVLVRLIFIFIAVITAFVPMVLFYSIAWAVMPNATE
jgi:phage shock protein C